MWPFSRQSSPGIVWKPAPFPPAPRPAAPQIPFYVPPEPMPAIRPALIYLPDAIAALQRAAESWNLTQLEQHIANAEAFIAAARSVMPQRAVGPTEAES